MCFFWFSRARTCSDHASGTVILWFALSDNVESIWVCSFPQYWHWGLATAQNFRVNEYTNNADTVSIDIYSVPVFASISFTAMPFGDESIIHAQSSIDTVIISQQNVALSMLVTVPHQSDHDTQRI